MCPDKDWFVNYKSINGGTVLMGNNMSCKVVGIGTIQIKMHDGIVRTLTGVRHVPELKKNLISLGILDSQGCKFSIYHRSSDTCSNIVGYMDFDYAGD